VEIRRIRIDDSDRLRQFRLRALADAPAAFGQTLAEAQKRTAEQWAAFARETATSEADTIFVAEDHGQWYGMAGAFVEAEHPDSVRLVSMWVDPARRRSGIGAALVEAVAEWARGRRARRLELWVTETNEPARSLYARQRFVATDQTKPLPSNPSLQEVLMVRELT
jgi:GNAT superfamily N-acetyltransferase